jgi:hypothetical protein
MSFKQICKERPLAADLLSLISFFNLQGILELVLRVYTTSANARANSSIRSNDDDDNDDSSSFNGDLNILLAYLLVRVIADSNVCEMHELVQFCTRE